MTSGESSNRERLERLQRDYISGAISAEEYARLREQVLQGQPGGTQPVGWQRVEPEEPAGRAWPPAGRPPPPPALPGEQHAVPELRPLGIGEILDVGIKITTRHFKTLAAAVLVVVVPLQTLASIVDLSAAEGALSGAGGFETDEFGNPQVDAADIWTFVAATLVALVLGLLAQTIATGACFKAVADAYLGRTPSWRRSTAEVLRRLHSIVWISVLTYLLGGLAFLACLIPGIWLFIAWTVAIPAFLTEEVKGRRALGRSFRLVRGFWWRTFAIIALGAILASIVSGALVGALTAVTLSSDSTLTLVIANWFASVAAGVLTTPFIAAITIVLYFDLRVRKEGFDLALLAARLGEGGESLPSVLPAPPILPPPPPSYTGGEQPPYWPPPPGWKPSGPGEP